MAQQPVVFKYGTRAQYDALAEKATNALYFLTDTGEIYRGAVNLARGSHYEGELTAEDNGNKMAVIARVLGTQPAVKDDIFVVKELIANDKYSHTSYIFDGANWKAMDGNYNAENVYFDENIMITTAVGNIGLTNGSAEIPASGKNLKQVFEAIWTKENLEPIVTNPAISLTASSNASGEVGSTFTRPTATLKITGLGKYEFGSKDSAGNFYEPDTTNVTFSEMQVGIGSTAAALTDEKSTTETGSFVKDKSITYTVSETDMPSNVFTDSAITVAFSADATHGGSEQKALSNLGNFVTDDGAQAADYASAGKAMASTTLKKENVKWTATGYRSFFYGAVDSATADAPIDSALIRGLTNGGAYNSSKTLTITAADVPGAKRILIAYPKASVTTTRKGLTGAIITSSLNYDALANGNYVKQAEVEVAGADGYATTVPYIVWKYEPDALDSTEVHKITLA